MFQLQVVLHIYQNFPGLLQMKKLQVELETEIERLKQARRELEFYSERTDLWLINTGQWRSQILQTQV